MRYEIEATGPLSAPRIFAVLSSSSPHPQLDPWHASMTLTSLDAFGVVLEHVGLERASELASAVKELIDRAFGENSA